MLTVTESAKRNLKEILLATTDDSEFGLRLSMKPRGQLGLMLVLDREAPGDYVVKHEGLKALLVKEELVPLVDGVTIGTQDTPEGPRLTISRE